MPVSSVERPVGALRQRMLEDMAMRGLRSHTQHDRVRFVRSFAAFLGRSPDTAQAEDIRRLQVHQRESGVQPPAINGSVSALRFFFTVTLDRPMETRHFGQWRMAVLEPEKRVDARHTCRHKSETLLRLCIPRLASRPRCRGK